MEKDKLKNGKKNKKSKKSKDTILSIRLKIARNKIGWTQEKVANKLNISIGTLSGYERGYRNPNYEMITKLANLYNVSNDWLFGETDDPNPSKTKKVPNKLHDDKKTKEKMELNDIFDKLPEEEREYLLMIAKVFESRDNQAATTDLPTSFPNGSGK